jgi:hypothetical protein
MSITSCTVEQEFGIRTKEIDIADNTVNALHLSIHR